VLDDGAVPLSQMRRPSRLILLLGNEADGLEQNWIDLSDDNAAKLKSVVEGFAKSFT